MTVEQLVECIKEKHKELCDKLEGAHRALGVRVYQKTQSGVQSFEMHWGDVSEQVTAVRSVRNKLADLEAALREIKDIGGLK